MKKSVTILTIFTVAYLVATQVVFSQGRSASEDAAPVADIKVLDVKTKNEASQPVIQVAPSAAGTNETSATIQVVPLTTSPRVQEYHYRLPFSPEIKITTATATTETITNIIENQIFETCPAPQTQPVAISPNCGLSANVNSDQTYNLSWTCQGLKQCVITKNGKQFFSVDDNGLLTLPVDRFPYGSQAQDTTVNLSLSGIGNNIGQITTGQYVVLGAVKNPNPAYLNPTFSTPQVFDSSGKPVTGVSAGQIAKLVPLQSPAAPVTINATVVPVPGGTQICPPPPIESPASSGPVVAADAAQCSQVDIPPGTYRIVAVKSPSGIYSLGTYFSTKPGQYISGPDGSPVTNRAVAKGVLKFAQDQFSNAGVDPYNINPSNPNDSIKQIVQGLANSNGIYMVDIPSGAKANVISGYYTLTTNLAVADPKTGLDYFDNADTVISDANSVNNGASSEFISPSLAKDLITIFKNIVYGNSYSFSRTLARNTNTVGATNNPDQSAVTDNSFYGKVTAYVAPQDCSPGTLLNPPRCKKAVPPGNYTVIPVTKNLAGKGYSCATCLSFNYADPLPGDAEITGGFNSGVRIFDSAGQLVTDQDIIREIIRIANEKIWAMGIDPRAINPISSFGVQYSSGFLVDVPAGLDTNPVRGYFKVERSSAKPPSSDNVLITDYYSGTRVIDPEVVKKILALLNNTQIASAAGLVPGNVAPIPLPSGNERITITSPRAGAESFHATSTGAYEVTWNTSGLYPDMKYKVRFRASWGGGEYVPDETSPFGQVKLVNPVSGMFYTVGAQNRISWKGGWNKVQIGLAKSGFSFTASSITSVGSGGSPTGWQRGYAQNYILGYIVANGKPNGSIVWDGKTVCDSAGNNCHDITQPHQVTVCDASGVCRSVTTSVQAGGAYEIFAISQGLYISGGAPVTTYCVGDATCNADVHGISLEVRPNELPRTSYYDRPTAIDAAAGLLSGYSMGGYGQHTIQAVLYDTLDRPVATDTVAFFTREPKITVVSPVGGENFNVNQPFNIQWKTQGIAPDAVMGFSILQKPNYAETLFNTMLYYFKNPTQPLPAGERFVISKLTRPNGDVTIGSSRAGDGQATVNLSDGTARIAPGATYRLNESLKDWLAKGNVLDAGFVLAGSSGSSGSSIYAYNPSWNPFSITGSLAVQPSSLLDKTLAAASQILNYGRRLFDSALGAADKAIAFLSGKLTHPVSDALAAIYPGPGFKFQGYTAATDGTDAEIFIVDKDIPPDTRPYCEITSKNIVAPPPALPVAPVACKQVTPGNYTAFGLSSSANPGFLDPFFSTPQIFDPSGNLVNDSDVIAEVTNIAKSRQISKTGVVVNGSNVFVPAGTPICSGSASFPGTVFGAPALATPASSLVAPATVASPTVTRSRLQTTDALWYGNQDAPSVPGAPFKGSTLFTLPSYALSFIGPRPVNKALPGTEIFYDRLADKTVRLRMAVNVKGANPLLKGNEKFKLQYAVSSGWGGAISSNPAGGQISREKFLQLFGSMYSRAYVSQCQSLSNWDDVGTLVTFKDNPGVNAQAIPVPNIFGPAGSTQTYSEVNPFTTQNSNVAPGGYAVFDFPVTLPNFVAPQSERDNLERSNLVSLGMPGSNTVLPMIQSKSDFMCFRMVREDGTPLDEIGKFPVVWRENSGPGGITPSFSGLTSGSAFTPTISTSPTPAPSSSPTPDSATAQPTGVLTGLTSGWYKNLDSLTPGSQIISSVVEHVAYNCPGATTYVPGQCIKQLPANEISRYTSTAYIGSARLLFSFGVTGGTYKQTSQDLRLQYAITTALDSPASSNAFQGYSSQCNNIGRYGEKWMDFDTYINYYDNPSVANQQYFISGGNPQTYFDRPSLPYDRGGISTFFAGGDAPEGSRVIFNIPIFFGKSFYATPEVRAAFLKAQSSYNQNAPLRDYACIRLAGKGATEQIGIVGVLWQ